MNKFLAGNRLSSWLAIIGLGFAETFVVAGFLPAELTIGQVLAVLGSAVVATYQNRETDPHLARPVLLLLLCFCFILLIAGLRAVGAASLIRQILPMLPALAGLAALAHVTRNKGNSFARVLSTLISSGCLIMGAIVAWTMLDNAVRFLPRIYDPVLYRIDSILGLDPTYRLADILRAHPEVRRVILWIYEYNLVFAVPAVLSECFYSRKSSAELNLQLLISSFLVFPLFCLMPALAPAFYFGSAFPDHLPAVSMAPRAVATQIETIRNTFPSLHATWAILIFLALRSSPFAHRLAGSFYLLATFVATLGFGEHYAVDWVAACPLVLIVRAVCCTSLTWRAKDRWMPFVAGVAMLGLWIIIVRGAPMTLATLTGGWLVRALGLASVGLFIAFETRLSRAEPFCCRPLMGRPRRGKR